MRAVVITLEGCCEGSDKRGPIRAWLNREGGLLHYRCVFCGFELHAGSEYSAKWTPHHGVEVYGIKPQ